MPKYRIVISKGAYSWIAFLYKRFFFLWWEVDVKKHEFPYGRAIIDWQEKYNIPDERVYFQ